MAVLATLQTRLGEAEAAYHRLMTGAMEVEVQHETMTVKYSEASLKNLQSYIADLKAQIQAAGGSVDGLRRRAFVVDLP